MDRDNLPDFVCDYCEGGFSEREVLIVPIARDEVEIRCTDCANLLKQFGAIPSLLCRDCDALATIDGFCVDCAREAHHRVYSE